MKGSISIIGSDFINALSIFKSLKKSKYEGIIYSISSPKHRLLSTLYNNSINSVVLNDSTEILPFLLDLPKNVKKYLFLTNELYHQVLYDNKEVLYKNNVFFYFGQTNPSHLFDKLEFNNIFKKNKLINTPNTVELKKWKREKITFPLIIKFKKSFTRNQKTLPVKIVKSSEDLNKYIEFIKSSGFQTSDLIVQEKLSSESKDNISIVGWYDYNKKNNVFHQTRKIIQHPVEGGTGDLIELMETDDILKKTTKIILNNINYIGPFEIEFIKSENSDEYKLLEINPRFWMQHGLIGAISGERLINNYISHDILNKTKGYKYWINLPHYLTLLFKLNEKAWRYLPKVIMQSYSPISLKELILYAFRKNN